ncbi:MAG: Tol-Pal system protein TolB [Rickettsiaceae bacterium]|nr:MAG: Tol-Pal system protein TolB [Rickettsiaceae bacterium]
MRNSLFLLFIIYSAKIFAIDTIDITKGHNQSIPLSINYFDARNASEKSISDSITTVITSDLKNCGLFRIISSSSFIENSLGIYHKPLFAAWRQVNSNFLINGQLKKISNNKIEVSFILWDVFLEKNILSEELEVPINLWRSAAHKIANRIYEQVTGDLGYFDTKIAYVSETGSFLKRQKKIALMDYDGANHKYITSGKNLVLTPRMSPKGDVILYLSYINKYPYIHLKNLNNGTDELIQIEHKNNQSYIYLSNNLLKKNKSINNSNMIFAPRFSPTGDKLLLSIAKSGSTHIYLVDLRTLMQDRKAHLVRLTEGNSINTSPCYSPDGEKIVFNSDRGGSNQIYVMNADGSNIQRISFGGGRYATPNWSPVGNNIAFTKITKGEGYTIGVMAANGTRERIISSGFLVEGPVWTKNGKGIAFTRSSQSRGNIAGKSRIYYTDTTGGYEYEIVTPEDASDPEWSTFSY